MPAFWSVHLIDGRSFRDILQYLDCLLPLVVILQNVERTARLSEQWRIKD